MPAKLTKIMKRFNHQAIGGLAVAAALVLMPSSRATDTNSVTTTKPKPDLLKTCPVSGEKIGGDMGKPYTFVYQGQEVNLCCPMCKAKFDKDPNAYIKIIQAADKNK
jgi:YHS domain-containing protein